MECSGVLGGPAPRSGLETESFDKIQHLWPGHALDALAKWIMDRDNGSTSSSLSPRLGRGQPRDCPQNQQATKPRTHQIYTRNCKKLYEALTCKNDFSNDLKHGLACSADLKSRGFSDQNLQPREKCS